jgi:hypothetical protein
MAGMGISFASFLRFWAVAARRNSVLAPCGPLSRSRFSRRTRFRCAKSTSTFLHARRDCSKAEVPDSDPKRSLEAEHQKVAGMVPLSIRRRRSGWAGNIRRANSCFQEYCLENLRFLKQDI